MRIERISVATEDLYLALQRLIPQLTVNHLPPSRAEVDLLASSPGTILLIARSPEENGPIIGVAALIIYRVPSGVRARLEDVIVDESARGLGIGEALTLEALRFARQAGADGVALTSHPRRKTANRLYKKVGFKLWETNLYFYKF